VVRITRRSRTRRRQYNGNESGERTEPEFHEGWLRLWAKKDGRQGKVIQILAEGCQPNTRSTQKGMKMPVRFFLLVS
jgi:hypothetical protein